MPADHPALHAQDPLVDLDLRAAFGLTAAEGRVVGQLLQGHSVKRMAAELGISGHTVRTHLKRALTKADAHSQVELVVRIFVLERRRGWLS
jgi:DNA-binding CsgD family transcriptional regulator